MLAAEMGDTFCITRWSGKTGAGQRIVGAGGVGGAAMSEFSWDDGRRNECAGGSGVEEELDGLEGSLPMRAYSSMGIGCDRGAEFARICRTRGVQGEYQQVARCAAVHGLTRPHPPSLFPTFWRIITMAHVRRCQ